MGRVQMAETRDCQALIAAIDAIDEYPQIISLPGGATDELNQLANAVNRLLAI